MDLYEKYRSTVPEGRAGEWAVERFVVNEADASFTALRAALNPHRGELHVPANSYTRLTRGSTLVMSDTPGEVSANMEPIWRAQELGGHCLVTGLGLGIVTLALLEMENVEAVTVVEQSVDVIALVAPHVLALHPTRFRVVHADALRGPTVLPGTQFTVAWHDIWDFICADNLPGMKRLTRRYQNRCTWQGCWQRDLIERLHD